MKHRDIARNSVQNTYFYGLEHSHYGLVAFNIQCWTLFVRKTTVWPLLYSNEIIKYFLPRTLYYCCIVCRNYTQCFNENCARQPSMTAEKCKPNSYWKVKHLRTVDFWRKKLSNRSYLPWNWIMRIYTCGFFVVIWMCHIRSFFPSAPVKWSHWNVRNSLHHKRTCSALWI